MTGGCTSCDGERPELDIVGLFRPRAALTDEERVGGLRAMTWQAVSASAADGFASGGFLAAFALAMGANNTQIGIMTALPFLVQPLQVLALVVVERTGMRKAVAVGAYFIAYAAWVPVALIPFALSVPHAGAVTVLLALVASQGCGGSVCEHELEQLAAGPGAPGCDGRVLRTAPQDGHDLGRRLQHGSRRLHRLLEGERSD